MNTRNLIDPNQSTQTSAPLQDVDVPRYYVWGTDDSGRQPLYWILDSTRDDLEVAGPMSLESARVLADELNEASWAKERVLVIMGVASPTSDGDRPETGKLYQLTGGPGERCLLNTGRWADSEIEG